MKREWNEKMPIRIRLCRLPAPWDFTVLAHELKDFRAWKSKILDQICDSYAASTPTPSDTDPHYPRSTTTFTVQGMDSQLKWIDVESYDDIFKCDNTYNWLGAVTCGCSRQSGPLDGQCWSKE